MDDKECDEASRCAGVKDLDDEEKPESWMCADESICGQSILVEDKDITVAVSCSDKAEGGAIKILAGAASLIAVAYAI